MRAVTVATVLVAALAPCARAQTAPAASPWKTQIDLGYVQATGNTRLRTLHLADQVVYAVAPWKFTQTFEIVSAADSAHETANNLKAGIRGDYAFGSRVAAYAYGTYERDRFAGIARRTNEQAGLSLSALAAPRDTLAVEAGAGLIQQRGTDSVATSQNYGSTRLAARLRHTFKPDTYAEVRGEVLNDLSDAANTQVNADGALVAPLSRHVALKFDYAVRYRHEPEPGFRTTDTITSAGLQIAF